MMTLTLARHHLLLIPHHIAAGASRRHNPRGSSGWWRRAFPSSLAQHHGDPGSRSMFSCSACRFSAAEQEGGWRVSVPILPRRRRWSPPLRLPLGGSTPTTTTADLRSRWLEVGHVRTDPALPTSVWSPVAHDGVSGLEMCDARRWHPCEVVSRPLFVG
jgi:hypothetical protein